VQPEKHAVNLSYNFFAGKLSVVWIFIISNIEPGLLSRIKAIYSTLTDRDFEIPLCSCWKEAIPYLQTEGSVFKIIIDLDNGPDLVKHK
jgi:hypothetical protein